MRQRNNAVISVPRLLSKASFILLLTVVPAHAQSTLCYAKPGGNDQNDGSYWAFAKGDIMACYDALPAAGGVIFVMDPGAGGQGVPACKPTDPPGCGIWIMGQGDPNYAHPPAGWRRRKGTVSNTWCCRRLTTTYCSRRVRPASIGRGAWRWCSGPSPESPAPRRPRVPQPREAVEYGAGWGRPGRGRIFMIDDISGL